jgi:tRNA(Ile)-lysidine synthetase-like protein
VNLPYGAGSIELSSLNSDDQNYVKFNKDSQSLGEIVELDFTALFGESRDVRLELRNWRPGDEILRPGHQNPEKIKALFQQYQIVLWQRRHWPVAVLLDNVVWARGFGAASPYIAKPESRQAVRLGFWPKADVTEL